MMADLWNVQGAWVRHAPREYGHSNAPLHGGLTLCAVGVDSCTACTIPAAQGAIRRCGRGWTCTGCCVGCCTSRRGIIAGKVFANHCCNDIHRGWRKLGGLAHLPSKLLRPQRSHPKHDTHGVRFRALHAIPSVAGQRLPNRVLFGISRVMLSSVDAVLNPTTASDNPTNNIVLDPAQEWPGVKTYATVCLLLFRPWPTASGLRHGHTTYAGLRSTIAPP